MPNWHILAQKLLIAQTAKNFFMSLINSWEDINHHLFLPQFLQTVFLTNFLLTSTIKQLLSGINSTGTSHALASPYNHDIEFQQTPFTSFQPKTNDNLHSVFPNCAPKSCELDSIPTSLPLVCLDAILPTMTSILMTPLSLVSFYLPTNLPLSHHS